MKIKKLLAAPDAAEVYVHLKKRGKLLPSRCFLLNLGSSSCSSSSSNSNASNSGRSSSKQQQTHNQQLLKQQMQQQQLLLQQQLQHHQQWQLQQQQLQQQQQRQLQQRQLQQQLQQQQLQQQQLQQQQQREQLLLLRFNRRQCSGGYPLKIKLAEDAAAAAAVKEETQLQRQLLLSLLQKLDWGALRQTAAELGIDLPPTVSESDKNDDNFLRAFQSAVLDLDIMEGTLVCPCCQREYPVSKGIPNMLLQDDEV
ncbi:hypothetical protein, conserved [Eimeria tenella]|uniref:Uncharacterized protein n=1 Tax=Eimeria tenella TaxID=5802 RepID=U6L509_EIMTE|nr:hypothetical protein, conserved [Eimeria tenella]CDJ45452.1 hypothetical protein, conserved [Eimeria tenella]|eukprot:XP_013236198.1 hypothetical protein, conserved [Eimeria tenella]